MAPDTDSPRNSPGAGDRDLSLRWSGRVSLTPRILAVNIIALALLAGGFFYLDCETREEAVALAAQCPAVDWATVEVRKVARCFEEQDEA